MIYDGIVIGGGPAGMLAAITAADSGQNVLLLEKNPRLGKKLLITGKGRCNVTNQCSIDEVLKNITRNGRFLYSALNTMPPERVMRFFEENGCALKTERGNRVFPLSDQAQSILDCLISLIKKYHVTVRHERVLELLSRDGKVIGVKCAANAYRGNWVVLATGGLSYPSTGSTGDGYTLAKSVGHTIIEPAGSLVPLEATGDYCSQMQGLSLRNIGIKLVDNNGKLLYKDFGELLFTHFGISGPVVLSASAHLKGECCRLLIDLKPALDEEKLNARILRDLEMYQNRSMENALTELLPRSMIPVILQMLQIPAQLQANALKREKRRMLVALLKAFPIEIVGKRPVSEAIVTSGGVKVSEINPKTMESKLISGLYFAGEIIDCDAYTGGFNLQIAWSSAYVAGSAVKNTD